MKRRKKRKVTIISRRAYSIYDSSLHDLLYDHCRNGRYMNIDNASCKTNISENITDDFSYGIYNKSKSDVFLISHENFYEIKL